MKKETAVELKPVVTKLAPPAATPRGGVSKQTAVRARGRGTGPTRGTPSRGNAANVTVSCGNCYTYLLRLIGLNILSN